MARYCAKVNGFWPDAILARDRSFYDVKSVAFSPDSTLLAVADAWAVTLWDVATRRELDTLPGKPANSSVVTFSRDGVTASYFSVVTAS